MSRARIRGGIAGLLTGVVFAVVMIGWGTAPPVASEPNEKPRPKTARPAAKPVEMPASLVGLELSLGLKDKEPTPWAGSIEVSKGRVLAIDILRGNPQARVEEHKFFVRSIRRPQAMIQGLVGPVLRVTLDAPLSANVTVTTRQGKFAVALNELVLGVAKKVLEDQASVERQDGALRLTGPKTEDDYPALARGKDGAVWLAYVEYVPGQPIDNERVQAGNFDMLEPRDNGDQVLLVRFDGKSWEPALEVSAPRQAIWRPTVAVDGQGKVLVAWAQQVNGDWEIFYRRYTPHSNEKAKGEWSAITRLTHEKGSDFNVVATTDAKGVVWLAWQAWRKNNFDITLTALAEAHLWTKPRIISESQANDWSPAIAADSRGNVFVAWDTYDRGNYDVQLCQVDREGHAKTHTVAGSAHFEARPSLTCDAADRLWIAYEEGDEQWGKDYSNNQFRRIGLTRNPGFALYIKRTIRVKCLADGKLVQPAADLEHAFANRLRRNKSLPRLVVDAAGGLWLLLRHHPSVPPGGEVWSSFALRYDGKTWSTPRHLAASEDLLDNRPALLPFGQGVLVVHTSDQRSRTQNRNQNDLFATVLGSKAAVHLPELEAAPSEPPAKVRPVHQHEMADVARMRNHRIEAGGKKLHLRRGEFHRHTEFSSHTDQDGLLEDAWRYALDAARLDWIGIGDHDNGFGSEYMWWHFQKMTELHNNQPSFTAVHTYERSVVYPDGHRNAILPRKGIRPLPRGSLKGTEEKGTPDTKTFFAYLKHFGGICASHTSATTMGTDWRDNNPEMEPAVEIYQGHRHNYEHFGAPRSATEKTQIGGFRPKGFVWLALEKGYRFGFQASSDHISTHMSYAVVLTDDVSARGLIAAFKKRHCYAATDNILVDVRSGSHIMGDAFESAKKPTLEIQVHGTGPIARVHVIRDNKYVYTTEPNKQIVNLRYTDVDAKKGKTSYYYVRIEQEDGNLAWASPMWITYKP
jgi:hypothetical protein